MTSIRTLSRPYAKAAYEVAKNENKEDHWLEFFRLVSKLTMVDKVKKILNNETIVPEKILANDQFYFLFLQLHMLLSHKVLIKFLC
jgi:F0F1-type ATP synthase delta subunit